MVAQKFFRELLVFMENSSEKLKKISIDAKERSVLLEKCKREIADGRADLAVVGQRIEAMGEAIKKEREKMVSLISTNELLFLFIINQTLGFTRN